MECVENVKMGLGKLLEVFGNVLIEADHMLLCGAGWTSRILMNRSGVGVPVEDMVVTIGDAVETPDWRIVD